MKKTLLLLASVALLLVGCQKEKFAEEQVGGLTEVTFTASLDNSVATKAAVDGDGAAASVNRCIMEIYYDGERYTREYAPVGTDKKATFKVQVPSNRTYTVAFWADCVDCVGGVPTKEELAIDKYYTTNTDGLGLKAITIKDENDDDDDIAYIGNNDARDAFFHVGSYTVAQAGSSFGSGEDDKILLKRPFAQMNVITTDWDKAASVTGLAPENVKVTLKNALNSFNAVTGEASGSQTLEYTATVYTPAANGTEKTLSMDYLFAPKTDKAFIDIDWKAKHGTDTDVAHSFAAVPYQRNYRTNIKGALLTTQGQWTVTVSPIWAGEITHPVVIATTLEQAQAAIGPATTGTEAAGTVIVKPEAVTNRDQTKDKTAAQVQETTSGINLPTGAKAIEFILTPQSKKDVTFELPALPADTETETFYWYIRHETGYPTEHLNVKVSDTNKTRVIIDAPTNTHVVLNGVLYDHTIVYTGDNTLVVPEGITVKKLTVKKGGVEIHGTVETLEVAPESGKNVYFRSCENLSQTVFEVIKGETPTPKYIAEGYSAVKGRTTADKWDIVPAVCKIGDAYYGSLDDAFKAVPENVLTTVTVFADANETFKTRGAELKKDQKVILDLNGHKLVGTSMESGYTQYIYVENGGELTVKDSRTGGAIEYHDGYIENLTSGSGTGGSAITCHGCMTLESGTIENKTPDTKTNDLEGAIDMYTNAWGQAYSPADIVLNIKGGVIKSNNANTVRLTSFSSQTYTTSVTVNMNGGEVYGRDGFFIQGVSESYLNTNTLNLNSGKVYGTQAVRVMAWQNHENASESKPVTIRIREGVDIKNNYFAQSGKDYWSEGICIDNLSGTFEQLLSYVNIITPVCKIDNSYFFSLSDAVAAVGTEETTITMLRDIKFTESVNIGTRKIILNTNGMNLDATGLRAIEIYGGKLTVNGDGKFFAHNATGDNNAILNLYLGELVVNEVYLEGANTCIGVTGGTATINNATMKALDGGCCVFATYDGVINIYGMIFTCAGDDLNGPGSCWASNGGTVNVYGGTFNAAPLNNVTHELETDQADYCLYDYFDAYPTPHAQTPGHIYVYGGTFNNFNPANNYSGHSFLAEGYQSVQDGNNWIVSAINN